MSEDYMARIKRIMQDAAPTQDLEASLTKEAGQFPNCEKLSVQGDFVGHVMEFLEWLESESGAGLAIVAWHGDYYVPSELRHEELLQKFLGVDRDQLEKERRELLEKAKAEAETKEDPKL